MKLASWKHYVGFLLLVLTSAGTIAQAPMASISGRLISPTGAAVPNVEIILGQYPQYLTNVTKADGAFTFTVPQGVWGLYIPTEQIPGLIAPTFTFPIFETTNIVNVEAKLLSKDAVITGVLKGPDGRPLGNVRLDAYRVENNQLTYSLNSVATTDEAGQFTIAASKGPWLIWPQCGDMLGYSLDCIRAVEVDASSGAASMTIIATTGPAPTIENVRVEITRIPNSNFAYAELIFTVRGEPAGYDIQGRHDVPIYRYSWPDVNYVAIPKGATSAEVRIPVDSYPSAPPNQFFRIRRTHPPE